MSSLIDNKYILPKPIHLLDFLTYTSQVRLSVILPSLSVSLISLSNGLTSSRLVQMMSSLPDTNSIHPTHIRLPSFLVYTSPVRWNVIPCVLSLSNVFTSSIHENLSYLSFSLPYMFATCLSLFFASTLEGYLVHIPGHLRRAGKAGQPVSH